MRRDTAKLALAGGAAAVALAVGTSAAMTVGACNLLAEPDVIT